MLGYAATTNFGITLASLATGSARESNAITAVVGGTGYDDYQLELSFGVVTPTTAGSQVVNIWFAASSDGTNFTAPATGADSAIVLGTHRLFGPFVQPIPVGTNQYQFSIPSVAQFFGGILPKKFSVIFENQTNGAASGTEANFNKWFTPMFYTT